MTIKEKSPVLSVGLPVYNGGQFLEELLDSILAQSFDDFELVISNNASDDNTAEICRRYAVADARIRYYEQEENIGLFPNIEFVFSKTRGCYFCMVAHDDKYESNYFEKLMTEHLKDHSLDIVYSDYGYIDENGRLSSDNLAFFMNKSDSPYKNFRRFLRKRITLPVFFGIFKKEVFHLGLPFPDFRNNLTASVDLVFLYRVLSVAKVHSIKDKLFYYRIKNRLTNIPASWRANKLKWKYGLFLLDWKIFFLYQSKIITKSNFTIFQKIDLVCYSFLIVFYDSFIIPFKNLLIRDS